MEERDTRKVWYMPAYDAPLPSRQHWYSSVSSANSRTDKPIFPEKALPGSPHNEFLCSHTTQHEEDAPVSIHPWKSANVMDGDQTERELGSGILQLV